MKKKYRILLFFICLTSNRVIAQTHIIDSLRNQFYQSQNRESKKSIALKICEQYYSLSADSLADYIKRGVAICEPNSEASLRFKSFYSFCFLKNTKTKEANLYLDSLLASAQKIQSDTLYFELHLHKAIALIRNNQYKEAIDSALKLLEVMEPKKDSVAIMKTYSTIGLANMELENEKEAILWFNKGLQYTSNENLLAQVSSLHLNISSCYRVIGKTDSALKYINQGLLNANKVENLTNVANALNIRGAIYSMQNKQKNALKDLEDALVIRKKIGDLHFIIGDLGQLANYYSYVGQHEKSISVALEGVELAKQSGNAYKLIYLKKILSSCYNNANKFKEAYKTALEVIALKDSLYEKNTANDIAELSTQYELQKKENIIIQQENNLIKSKYTNIGSLLALLLGSVIAWLLYRNYSHKQKLKLQEALAEEKLNSIHAVQFAEEKERKRIAADLHDNLGSYAAAITSNIRYLKDQSSAENEQLVSQLDENAQGIVTQLSDSIWILKNEHLPITKLADRFKSWAQRLIQNYPSVIYDYEEEITQDVELPPAKILNLFLILKECLTNSLKHSDCTLVKIKFISSNGIKISIEDNGKGFQTNLINRGNGIDNIKYRAKECGLHVKWKSLEPSGTQVTINGATTN
jgi:signal transduction histidine kinase